MFLCSFFDVNVCIFFFVQQKTAYDMCISDWSSVVCSSDLVAGGPVRGGGRMNAAASNAMTSGHAWPPSLQRSLAMFRACAPRPAVRVLCLVAVALLVTGAVLIAVYAPRPERGAIGAVTLVSFAITAPWAVWCSRLLLLRMEAQAWRMPALPAAIPVALLHVLLATVAVPATLLVLLAGAEPLFAAS